MVTLVYTLIADVFVTVLGKVLDLVDADEHPERIGVWLLVFVGVLHFLASVSFLCLGSKYKEYR